MDINTVAAQAMADPDSFDSTEYLKQVDAAAEPQAEPVVETTVETPVEPQVEVAPIEETASQEPTVTSAPAESTQEDPQAGNRVPIERFRTVTEERRAAKEEAARLTEENRLMREALQRMAQPQKAAEEAGPSIRDMRKQYHAALLEGDMDQADTIADQMDNLRRQEIERDVLDRALHNAESRFEQRAAASNFNTTLSNVLTDYPQFVEDSPEYDPQLTADAMDIAQGFIARGTDPTQAMLRAVAISTKAYGVQSRAEAAQSTASAAADATPPSRPVNMQAKQQAARATPPATHTHGSSGGVPAKHDISAMTFDDYEKLTAEERKTLLGY